MSCIYDVCLCLLLLRLCCFFFFFKQKTAYEMRISDWSSDVCSSDLGRARCATAGLSGLHPALGGQACVDHPFARPTVGEGVRQVVEPGSDLLVAVVGRRWAALGSLISELRGFVAASGFVLGELGLRCLRPIQEIGRASCWARVCQ